MTLIEELKAKDLASDKPDNIYARILTYLANQRNEGWKTIDNSQTKALLSTYKHD